jgi:hypothetical protein
LIWLDHGRILAIANPVDPLDHPSRSARDCHLRPLPEAPNEFSRFAQLRRGWLFAKVQPGVAGVDYLLRQRLYDEIVSDHFGVDGRGRPEVLLEEKARVFRRLSAADPGVFRLAFCHVLREPTHAVNG